MMVCQGKSEGKARKKNRLFFFDAAVTIDCCIKKRPKKKESERVQGDGKKSVKLGREKKQTKTSKNEPESSQQRVRQIFL